MTDEAKPAAPGGVNMKLLLGIICFPVGLVFWFFPCFGSVLCSLVWVAGLVLVILGILEMQKGKAPEQGGEKAKPAK